VAGAEGLGFWELGISKAAVARPAAELLSQHHCAVCRWVLQHVQKKKKEKNHSKLFKTRINCQAANLPAAQSPLCVGCCLIACKQLLLLS